jgi:hypothetical protein
MPAEGLPFECSWSSAFNLSSGVKGTFGYLFDWSGLGGLILAKDILIWNPAWGSVSTLPDEQILCAGVIERLWFDGGSSDPIRIACFVSRDNQTNIQAKLSRDLLNTKVKTSFALIDYDEYSKSWYEAVELSNPRRLSASVNTVDGELQVSVDANATRVTPHLDLEVYRFTFELVPSDRTQAEIQFASGPTQRLVRKWAAV